MAAISSTKLSCGVLVTDGGRLLLGHATRSPRWDIPKGLGEPGETPAETAARELAEETGLLAGPEALIDLGRHRYLPGKALALFAWWPAAMPDPAALVCRSSFAIGGAMVPEFDRFGVFEWNDAVARTGKNMQRVLGAVRDRV